MAMDAFWEYEDPGKSEAAFRTALASAAGDEALELLTQVARARGLQDDFEGAHRLLDQVESELATAGPRPHLRYLLERGRAFNSSGEGEKARQLFERAWDEAQSAGEDGLAVDAAHMVAITLAGTPEAEVWTRRGLDLAQGSKDPKAISLVPALLNNHGWDLHDMGRFEDALSVFEQAHGAWRERGKPGQIHVARWSVAHCLRSLGRHAEALAMLRELEAEGEAGHAPDPFVFDELAENLTALGDTAAAGVAQERAADLRKEGRP
jgi:tetratricopeptide (TPR) repeat protein